jgi:hypothetical protein
MASRSLASVLALAYHVLRALAPLIGFNLSVSYFNLKEVVAEYSFVLSAGNGLHLMTALVGPSAFASACAPKTRRILRWLKLESK